MHCYGRDSRQLPEGRTSDGLVEFWSGTRRCSVGRPPAGWADHPVHYKSRYIEPVTVVKLRRGLFPVVDVVTWISGGAIETFFVSYVILIPRYLE